MPYHTTIVRWYQDLGKVEVTFRFHSEQRKKVEALVVADKRVIVRHLAGDVCLVDSKRLLLMCRGESSAFVIFSLIEFIMKYKTGTRSSLNADRRGNSLLFGASFITAHG